MARIPAADRRTALVQAALRVVARDGVAAATTRRIVAEAGMSLASFHYVFESRDELMAELIEAAVAAEQSDVAPVLGGSGDGAPRPSMREAVRSGLQHYLDGVRAHPDREKAMFELTHWALREPGFEPLARRQYDRYFRLAEQAASEAAQLSGCAWSRPLPEVARLLVTLTDGLTVAWLVTRDDAAAQATIEFSATALAALAAPDAPADAPDAAPAPDAPDAAPAAAAEPRIAGAR